MSMHECDIYDMSMHDCDVCVHSKLLSWTTWVASMSLLYIYVYI